MIQKRTVRNHSVFGKKGDKMGLSPFAPFRPSLSTSSCVIRDSIVCQDQYQIAYFDGFIVVEIHVLH